MAGKCVKAKKIDYVDTLDQISRERYVNKIKLIGARDPYTIGTKEWRDDPDIFPDVTYPDIVNYLVFQQSVYSLEDLKAYKSLESYNYFINGWVKEVKCLEVNGHCLVTSRVRFF